MSNIQIGSERESPETPDSEKPSAKDALREFATETSLHGAKHVANHERRAVARAIWLLLLLGMAGGLVYTTVDLILRYFANPYTTTYSIKVVEKLPLPGVTICLQASINREKLQQYPNPRMLTEYLLRYNGWVLKNNETSSEILNVTYGNLSVDDIVDNCSPVVTDVVTSMTLGDEILDIATAFRSNVFKNMKCFSWNTASFKEYGFQPRTGSHLDGLKILFYINSTGMIPTGYNDNLLVYIHDPLEFLPGDYVIQDQVPINSGAQISLKVLENIFLPAPYSSFGGKQCIKDTSKRFESPLGQNITYTWSNCIMHNAGLRAAEQCQCVTGWTRGLLDYPTCNLAQKRDCYDIVEYEQTDKAKYDGECTVRCSAIWYEHTTQVTTDTTLSTINFFKEILNDSLSDSFVDMRVSFYSPVVTVMEHKPALTFMDIFSLSGGQMGFFLGASLLTVAEILEVAVTLMWGAISRLCRYKQRISPQIMMNN